MDCSTSHIEALAVFPIQQNQSLHEDKAPSNLRDRDSGVFLSDTEDTSSTTVQHKALSPSTNSSSTPARSDSTARRLRRPTELNLQSSAASNSPKPVSELQQRFDLIRNSQTQRKATLKSPTQLLQDRLNLSPRKEKEEKIRIFTPPQPMLNGCILPSPQAQLQPFQGSSVRARTEKGQRPAWWCKFDKVVVFDGIEDSESGQPRIQTRTSKGLSIARRRGDLETIVIPLDCTHCQEMLNRHEWKYDVQVCKRSVCWDCRERCQWEMAGGICDSGNGEAQERVEIEREANRERADSVLQDQLVREEELCENAGIEVGQQSPTMVAGIEERLDTVDVA